MNEMQSYLSEGGFSIGDALNDSFNAMKPDQSGSNETLTAFDKDLMSFYLMGVSTMCICCLGAIGNILCLIVLTKRPVGSATTNLYLIALAVADLLVLFATILTAVKDSRRPQREQLAVLRWQDAPFIPEAYPYFHSTAILFQVTSVWLTVAFTGDRYLMICHPFFAKRWCTVRLTRISIVIIYLMSVVYGIPRYFEYRGFEVYVPKSNPTEDDGMLENLPLSEHFQRIVWYDLTEFGSSSQFRTFYHLWSWNILVVALPFVSIAVMNSFLICEVRRSRTRNVKQNLQKVSRRQDTNIMLIGVIVVFFICQTPAAISHFSWGVIPLADMTKLPWYLLNEIGNLLVVVNSAINLVPYYLFSRRFRRQFTLLFCPYRIIRDDGLHCVYVPRWIADHWEKDLSDNWISTADGAGQTGDGTGGGGRGAPVPLNARLIAYHRRQSTMHSIRPSVSSAPFGKSSLRPSGGRTERTFSNGQRMSSGIVLQTRHHSNSREGSFGLAPSPRGSRNKQLMQQRRQTQQQQIRQAGLQEYNQSNDFATRLHRSLDSRDVQPVVFVHNIV
ncbi:hypothetical protein CRM22_001806 [Opisthorchis felineus]|uniref:G-protein coupled receptors family 1 profile domain-containing protein n=3 Tax=Opisthorchiidae TaxID=6196 RepID=A0A4S2M8V6_OPIFE|nr:hypothetical protein CRM22_001806 [Opisthorchis felineus]